MFLRNVFLILEIQNWKNRSKEQMSSIIMLKNQTSGIHPSLEMYVKEWIWNFLNLCKFAIDPISKYSEMLIQ